MGNQLTFERGTYSIEEVAVRLGIDRGTAYRLASTDRLPVPVIRLGKRLVIGRAALDRVLANDMTGAISAQGEE